MKTKFYFTMVFVFLTMNIAAAADLHVYPNSTIQNAISIALPGDTVIVHNGTYKENVNVDKTLAITSHSKNPTDTIVEAADKNKPAFYVSADSVNINGFYITGTSGLNIHGIHLVSSNNSTISNNKVSFIEHGDGIHLVYSNNNMLSNNTLDMNGLDGIRLSHSKNNILNSNMALDNGWNGFFSEVASGNILSNNAASGNDLAGINGYMSEKDIFVHNYLSENEIGIYLYNSQDMIISGNNASSNEQGIYLHVCPNTNSVDSNKVLNNVNGLFLVKVSKSKINDNNVSRNNYGMYLSESSNNNTIYNNYFNNTRNIELDIHNNGNFWNITKTQGTNIINGPYLGGNYWAQPDGKGFSQINKDVNADGIVNSPYKITENNVDYLPLTVTDKNSQSLLTVLILGMIMIITVFFLRRTLKKYI